MKENSRSTDISEFIKLRDARFALLSQLVELQYGKCVENRHKSSTVSNFYKRIHLFNKTRLRK